MKKTTNTKLVTLFLGTLFLLSFNVKGEEQDNYRIYPKEMFKIKSSYKLQVYTDFMNNAKQYGVNNLMAYVFPKDTDNTATGELYNINIYDLTEEYKKETSTKVEYDFYTNYEKGLKKLGYKYSIIEYQGVRAIEYEFKQVQLPHKAIIFLKNKKAYALQLATRNQLSTKFNTLKSSFEVLTDKKGLDREQIREKAQKDFNEGLSDLGIDKEYLKELSKFSGTVSHPLASEYVGDDKRYEDLSKNREQIREKAKAKFNSVLSDIGVDEEYLKELSKFSGTVSHPLASEYVGDDKRYEDLSKNTENRETSVFDGENLKSEEIAVLVLIAIILVVAIILAYAMQ